MRCHAFPFRCDLSSRGSPKQTIDDDPLLSAQALSNDLEVIHRRPGFNTATFHNILVVDDHHIGALLVTGDRYFRHKESGLFLNRHSYPGV